MFDYDNRKMLFKSLVGSHNYNLNTNSSDKDYKVFIIPTFEDLYNAVSFSHAFTNYCNDKKEDYDIHDIRQLEQLLWKSNINFMESLFSDELIINKDYKFLVEELFLIKEDLAKINLPYLYDACIGMSINKMKLLEKGTKDTKCLIDRYGYDTKNALHSYRILDFLIRYADNQFKDFKKAINYNNQEAECMLKIKDGFYDYEDILELISNHNDIVKENYKEIYKSFEPNFKLKERLENILKDIVKKSLEGGI